MVDFKYTIAPYRDSHIPQLRMAHSLGKSYSLPPIITHVEMNIVSMRFLWVHQWSMEQGYYILNFMERMKLSQNERREKTVPACSKKDKGNIRLYCLY